MDQKVRSKEYFDSIAEGYDTSFDGKYVSPMYQPILERVRGLKNKPQAILDLGCGNGNVIELLFNETTAKLYGADFSEKMIEEAKERLKGKAELSVGDAEHLPYKDGQFDVVICNASFHHYTNPKRALQEIRRVLKRRGTLILGDPTAPMRWYLKILNWSLKYSKSGDFHIYGKKEIKRILAEQGFQVSSFQMVNYRSFVLNAEI